MTIHTQVDKETYTSFFWYDNLSDIKRVLILVLMDILLFGLCIYAAVTSQTQTVWLFLGLGLGVPFLYFGVLFLRLQRRLRSANLYKEPIKVTYEVNKSGIRSINENTGKERTIAWKKLAKIKETKSHFYIYVANNHAMVLPKKDMTAEQVQKLAKWVVTVIQEKKRMGEFTPMLKG